MFFRHTVLIFSPHNWMSYVHYYSHLGDGTEPEMFSYHKQFLLCSRRRDLPDVRNLSLENRLSARNL